MLQNGGEIIGIGRVSAENHPYPADNFFFAKKVVRDIAGNSYFKCILVIRTASKRLYWSGE